MTLFFPHIFLLIIDVNLHKIILTTKSRIKRQEKHQRINFFVKLLNVMKENIFIKTKTILTTINLNKRLNFNSYEKPKTVVG